MTFEEFFFKRLAYDPFGEFCRRRGFDFSKCWNECPYPEWLLWVLEHMADSEGILVRSTWPDLARYGEIEDMYEDSPIGIDDAELAQKIRDMVGPIEWPKPEAWL